MNELRMISQCNLCLEDKKLIKSHILPQFFYANKGTVLISSETKRKIRRPKGLYDKNILCEDCDGFLGKYDNYAKEILINKKDILQGISQNPLENQKIIYYRSADPANYDKVFRFFLSVLWRASISFHEELKGINLGIYSEFAKSILTDNTIDSNSIFSVAICFFSNLSFPLIMFPAKLAKIEGVNFYIFIMGFFKVFIKCDQRKTPTWIEPVLLSKKIIFLC